MNIENTSDWADKERKAEIVEKLIDELFPEVELDDPGPGQFTIRTEEGAVLKSFFSMSKSEAIDSLIEFEDNDCDPALYPVSLHKEEDKIV